MNDTDELPESNAPRHFVAIARALQDRSLHAMGKMALRYATNDQIAGMLDYVRAVRNGSEDLDPDKEYLLDLDFLEEEFVIVLSSRS